ncbi:MAG: hypothetical protein PUF52_03620, partial [Prevotella sp.]|nr:hypothetical protein [Prevotella sp.]
MKEIQDDVSGYSNRNSLFSQKDSTANQLTNQQTTTQFPKMKKLFPLLTLCSLLCFSEAKAV